jgi:hypothetical protein
MEIGATLLIIGIIIAGIWILIETKSFRHKLFVIFLIGLIIFSYFSFNAALKKESVDYKSVSGLIDTSRVYFSWLGNIFSNIKSINSYVVKQNWDSIDNTENKTKE